MNSPILRVRHLRGSPAGVMFEAPNVVTADPLTLVQAYFKNGLELDKELEIEEAQLVERLKNVRQARDRLRAMNSEVKEATAKMGPVPQLTSAESGATAVGQLDPEEDPPKPDVYDSLITAIRLKSSTTDLIREALNITQFTISAGQILELLREFGWRGDQELLYSSLYRMKQRGDLIVSGPRGRQEYGLPSWKGRRP
jgi:hypothetical protein